jgi:hypothetical protein
VDRAVDKEPTGARAPSHAGVGDTSRRAPQQTRPAAVAGGSREQELQREVEHLRARLAALESELVETQARTNATVAEWQERVYWLDRWHLDLNALMRRRGAAELRASVRVVRPLFRVLRRAKRELQRRLREL